MSNKSISATVITLNEKDYIVECISSAKKVCNEIIVLDSGSTDGTCSVATQAGAKVYHQEYLGDGPQKKKAAELAANDWVLSIDADERLDEAAINAIKDLSLDDAKVAYKIKRKNYVGEHHIKAAGFYPNYLVRLYNRTYADYNDKKGHASVQAKLVKKIEGNIIHHAYQNYEQWLHRVNVLSTRDAWANADKSVTAFTIIGHSFFAFLKKLIFRGGIFQGVDGWTVAWTTAMKTHMKYLKIVEVQHNKENK